MNTSKSLFRALFLAVLSMACSGLFPTSLSAQENRASPEARTLPGAQQAFTKVEFESLELKGFFSREPVKLTGYLLKPVRQETSFPVVVFMHPCDGLLDKNAYRLNPKYATLAFLLRGAGVAVFMVDSFNPRGVSEICTTNPKVRTITESTRIQDAYGALKYLRSRSDVVPDRVSIVGWGASGTLETMDHSNAYLSQVGNRGFSAAVAFYPHCTTFKPYAPTLVLVGEKDTWNPPRVCLEVAENQIKESALLEVKIYPDAYHAFDAPGLPLTRRTDVPHVGPVTVGTNLEAKADAHARVQAFMKIHLGIGDRSSTANETGK